MEEVRRQFRDIKGIMEGTAKPEYDKAVDLLTEAAIKEMIIPSMLPLFIPIAVGLILGPDALGGLLMAPSSPACSWPSACAPAARLGQRQEIHRRKPPRQQRPRRPQAAVTGDTVGDPYKDTAGRPSIR